MILECCLCENEARYLLDDGRVACSLCAMTHPGRSVRFGDDARLEEIVRMLAGGLADVRRMGMSLLGKELPRVLPVWRCVRCGKVERKDVYEAEGGGYGHADCWQRVEPPRA